MYNYVDLWRAFDSVSLLVKIRLSIQQLKLAWTEQKYQLKSSTCAKLTDNVKPETQIGLTPLLSFANDRNNIKYTCRFTIGKLTNFRCSILNSIREPVDSIDSLILQYLKLTSIYLTYFIFRMFFCCPLWRNKYVLQNILLRKCIKSPRYILLGHLIQNFVMLL